MGCCGIGVIPLRTPAGRHLENLAHGYEFVQRVVDSGEADLGQSCLGEVVDGFSRQMHVVSTEHFGHHPSLRRETPTPMPQSLQQLVDDCSYPKKAFTLA